MKLPNNYGSISKLSGNRRRPYMARKTIAYDEYGKQIFQVLGYYPKREEALIALATYNQSPTPEPLITLSKVYRAWFAGHAKHVGQSAIESYRTSLRHLAPVLGMPIGSIKYRNLQNIIDDMRNKGLSYSSCKKVRSLINMLFDFAIINEWCEQLYGKYLELGKNASSNPHTIFTRQQINKLWRSSHEFAHLTLLMLYSGMRSIELRKLKKANVNMKQKFFDIKAVTLPIAFKTSYFITPVHYGSGVVGFVLTERSSTRLELKMAGVANGATGSGYSVLIGAFGVI